MGGSQLFFTQPLHWWINQTECHPGIELSQFEFTTHNHPCETTDVVAVARWKQLQFNQRPIFQPRLETKNKLSHSASLALFTNTNTHTAPAALIFDSGSTRGLIYFAGGSRINGIGKRALCLRLVCIQIQRTIVQDKIDFQSERAPQTEHKTRVRLRLAYYFAAGRYMCVQLDRPSCCVYVYVAERKHPFCSYYTLERRALAFPAEST